MSGYWRNITYLEKYVDHERIEKAGFAKLEYRKGILRGNIKITDEKSRTTAWKAYIGHQEEGTLFLRLLGTLIKSGSDFILEVHEESEKAEDKKLVLLGRSGEYCSEGMLNNLQIQVLGSEVEEEIELGYKPELQVEPVLQMEDEPQIEPRPEPEPESEVEPELQMESDLQPDSKSESEPEVGTEPQVELESEAELEPKIEPELSIEPEPPERPESIEESESEDWVEKILKVSAGMYPFSDNDLTQCARIEPNDFGLLPSKDWALGSNSFLLNGYYSYRHILFGVKEEEGERRCYLGVPGMYHRREIFMAKMFGFPMFKGVQAKKAAAIGDFGYWMMQI